MSIEVSYQKAQVLEALRYHFIKQPEIKTLMIVVNVYAILTGVLLFLKKIGFEKEYYAKIFEVFQKLHGKEQYAGTGIGLAIVKKIVENHQGIITVTSEINKGTTFDIYIPADKK